MGIWSVAQRPSLLAVGRAGAPARAPCLWPTKPNAKILESISPVKMSSSGISLPLTKPLYHASGGSIGESMASSMQLKTMTRVMNGSKYGLSTSLMNKLRGNELTRRHMSDVEWNTCPDGPRIMRGGCFSASESMPGRWRGVGRSSASIGSIGRSAGGMVAPGAPARPLRGRETGESPLGLRFWGRCYATDGVMGPPWTLAHQKHTFALPDSARTSTSHMLSDSRLSH